MSATRSPLPLDDYRATIQRAPLDAPADCVLLKQFYPDLIKSDVASRKVSFVISTGAVDRDRDSVKPDGWRLDSYRKNPVVLWGHRSRDLPIASAESIGTAGGALKATARFAMPGEDYDPDEWPKDLPTPDTVLRMLRGGFLRATSVGFVPVKSLWNESRQGIDFEEQELLEFSIVPVPSNPEALIDAKAAGIDVAPIKAWAERTLDTFEPGLWVPRARAEAAFKALAAPSVTVPAAIETVGRAQSVGNALLDFAIAIGKRGRVLSQANEDRIRAARDNAEELTAALDGVLSTLPEPQPELSAPTRHVPTYPVTRDAVRAATRDAIKELVATELRRHTGRLD